MKTEGNDGNNLASLPNFFSEIIKKKKITPEMAMCWRILMLALEDAGYIRYKGRHRVTERKDWRSSIRWMYGNVGNPFTFADICELFEIDPEHLLDLLKERKCPFCKKLIKKYFCLCC